jgi:hypothetical protein
VTPNLLARTVETVEGGGVVVLLLSSLDSLSQLYSLTMDVHSRLRTESHQEVTGGCCAHCAGFGCAVHAVLCKLGCFVGFCCLWPVWRWAADGLPMGCQWAAPGPCNHSKRSMALTLNCCNPAFCDCCRPVQ